MYSSATQLLYASVPSSGGPTLGNSIVSIDPNTGVLGTPIWVGSEPNRLALSSDGFTLWVGLDGASSVRKVDLNSGIAGIQFYLGGGNGIYNPSYTAKGLAVMPGSTNTVAVASSAGTVTIYDSGVPRTKTGTSPGYNSSVGVAFDNTGTYLYVAGSGYSVMQVDSTGVVSSSLLNSNVSSYDLRYDNGRSYLTSGIILNAANGNQLGVFSVAPSQPANGPVAPDSTIGRAFVLVNPNYFYNYQVNVYDLTTFNLLGSIPVPFAQNPYPQSPIRIVRWGQDGLAVPYGAQLYIFRSSLVRDLSSTLADVSVSTSAASSAATGSDISYNVTVTNKGPSTANPVTLLDFLPDGTTFKSLTVSQGNCAGGMVVRCDLGSLANNGVATVQITATALSSGKLTNTASVSAAQGDPNTSNNTANTDVTVSGNAYSYRPCSVLHFAWDRSGRNFWVHADGKWRQFQRGFNNPMEWHSVGYNVCQSVTADSSSGQHQDRGTRLGLGYREHPGSGRRQFLQFAFHHLPGGERIDERYYFRPIYPQNLRECSQYRNATGREQHCCGRSIYRYARRPDVRWQRAAPHG